MTTETILVDGKPLDIEVKPLTLLVHQGTLNVSVLGRLEINPELTVSTARALNEAEWNTFRDFEPFTKMYAMVWGVDPMPAFGTANLGQLHTVGLIALLRSCLLSKVLPFIKLPETYLHPAQQTGLADLFIAIEKECQP